MSNQAYQWRTNALLAIDQKYASDEASVANVHATSLAAILNETAMEISSSALSRATIAANAAKTFANFQAQEKYNLEIEMAGYEKDFAILAASGLATKMSDLSAATPSLWATREVGNANAESTRVLAVAGGEYNSQLANSGADLAYTIDTTLAATTYAIALANAESTQYVADVQANANYILDLAKLRANLTYNGTYDPSLILPIYDEPPILGNGEAWAHINEDSGLGSVSWYLPYYGDAGAWGYGYADYGLYNNWGGFFGAYAYYGYYGGYYGDPYYYGYGYGYGGYMPGYYGYYGGYYGGSYGYYGYTYDSYAGYMGLYGGYGYGWWSGYASAGWSQGTSVGSISLTSLNELTTAKPQTATNGSLYDVLVGNPVNKFMESLPKVAQEVRAAVQQAAIPVIAYVANEAASAAIHVARHPDDPKVVVTKALLKELADVADHADEIALDIAKGYAKGVLTGFFYDGLYGTVTDVLTLAYYGSPLSALHWAWDSAPRYFTGDWEGSQAQQRGEALAAAWEFGGKLKEVGEEALHFIKKYPQASLYLATGNTTGLLLLAAESSMSREGQGMLALITPYVKDITNAVLDQTAGMTAEDVGEITGRITGYLLYEVAETLATRGISVAAKSGRISKELYKISTMVEKVPGLSWANKKGAVKNALTRLGDAIAFVVGAEVCFVAGTPVHTLEGLKAIEEIRPGDLVLTRAESDGTRNVSPVYKPVLETFTTHPTALYHVTLQTDDGETETLSTTAGHPFYVADQQEFVYAEKLVAGDRLVLPEGRGAAVTEIRIDHAPAGETFTTYNFAVSETHTYFVGKQGVWVHNDGAPCDFLAMVYKSELDRPGGTPESAAAKMAAAADDLLANGTYATRAGRDQHMRDAAKKLGLPSDTPIPGPRVKIVETDGNVVELLANTDKGDVTVITEMTKQGDDLLLTGLHIDGPGAGSLGPATVKSIAKDFGRQQGAKRVIIDGGIRTTGANPGHTPRRITILVD